MKKINKSLIILLLILCLVGCSDEEKPKKVKEELLGIDYSIESNETTLDYDTTNPLVALYIKNYGTVIIELYPNKAKNTVNNFISLVKNGFYDNNTFHRLVPGFVLQGGDPTGTGTGGPGYSIKGEFSSNGVDNDLKHEKGIVSMARSRSNDSGGSQFFIMLGTSEHLDGDYAAFGKVIAGMDVVESIEKNEEVADEINGTLKNNLTLKKALVDIKEYTVEEVEKLEN